MRDIRCQEQPSMLTHIQKSEPSINLIREPYEDPFEVACEEAASRLLRSLRNVLDSTCQGAFSGKPVQRFHKNCPYRALSTTDQSNSRRRRRHSLESQSNAINLSPYAVGIVTNQKAIGVINVAFSPGKDGDVKLEEVEHPSANQFLRHPLALMSYVPKDLSLFFAGAIAGAVAKSVTAPLDRIKLLMQVHGVNAAQEDSRKAIGFLEATLKIGKEEGLQGYWKGNLAQVIRIVPYSAVQLFAYELYKNIFKGKDMELSVPGRLAAGACAGMTSTLVTYPLDVLRLRMAVDPACRSVTQVASTMLREEGLSSFYRGLGPSLIGIAPYIAMNFCVFDLVKKSLPEDFRKSPAASFFTALVSSSLATVICYPLDTVRRQLQMKGTPYHSVLDAIPGIIDRDGVIGLYRGFVPSALKSLPTSSIRLTTFDAAKRLINASQQEFQRLLNARRGQIAKNKV